MDRRTKRKPSMRTSPNNSKPGFKSTPCGEIPVDWKCVQLGEMCEVVGGSTPRVDTPEYWSGDIAWVTPSEITGLGCMHISNTKRAITERGLRSISARPLPEGSVLMTSRATIGYCALNTTPMVTNQGFSSFLCGNNAHNRYVYYLMTHMRPKLVALASGSTFKELSKSTVRNLPIPLPPLPEQRRIADILESVDDAIAKSRAVIEQTRTVKKALTQQLLTRGLPGRHTRFKKTVVGMIPEAWGVEALSEIVAKWQYGLSMPLSEKGTWPCLRMNNYSDGVLVADALKYVDLSDDALEKYRLNWGDVLFNRTNSADLVGKVGIFALSGTYVFASYLVRMVVDRSQALPEFVNLVLNTPCHQARIRHLATPGVSQCNVNVPTMKRLVVCLPPLAEQEEILEAVRLLVGAVASSDQNLFGLCQIRDALRGTLLLGKLRSPGRVREEAYGERTQ